MSHELYTFCLWALALAAPVIALALTRISAPYGRHARAGWGPTCEARIGWIVMEAPASIFFLLALTAGDSAPPAVRVLAGLWLLHYLDRAFVFPLRMRPGRRMPLAVAAMALTFNVMNGSINGHGIAVLGEHLRAPEWLTDPRFVVGVAVFACGWAMNHHADATLRRLRAPGESGYCIPRGGLFRWVSCPNYLGELVEWTGFAVAAWTPAAAVFLLFTAANLVPRALTHHRWYRERFSDYPAERRAIVPGLL